MLVDDDPFVRQSLRYQVEFADLESVEEIGPQLGTLPDFLKLPRHADAAISDYKLSPGGYAAFNGAELVSAWHRDNFPALLCTRYDRAEIARIRPHLRWIPVLMAPDDLNPDSLMEGLEACLFELEGNFRPVRRPWRAQVHFVEEDPEYAGSFFVELPAWQRDEVFAVKIKDLPAALGRSVKPGFRCYAQANLGSEDIDEIYLCEWEVR
ncbi:hypothetical protein [Cryobacterium soli]|uniref:hypothetical protein n=1 Tax=Cryobacterium soli TaxID=2220095 RepID=UPI0013C466F4|nr:hypothetical protein [Cryobacterium soli]